MQANIAIIGLGYVGLPLSLQFARSGSRVPPDLMVVVSDEGKIFHASGCPFIHDKVHTRTLVAHEAIKKGYAPCVRCMKKYLQADLRFPQSFEG